MLFFLRPAILGDKEFAAIPALVELLRQKYDALKSMKDAQAHLNTGVLIGYYARYSSSQMPLLGAAYLFGPKSIYGHGPPQNDAALIQNLCSRVQCVTWPHLSPNMLILI